MKLNVALDELAEMQIDPESIQEGLEGMLSLAVTLLMRVVPILDLNVREHNDGGRLRLDILWFLAGQGFPGWITERSEEWGGDEAAIEEPRFAELVDVTERAQRVPSDG